MPRQLRATAVQFIKGLGLQSLWQVPMMDLVSIYAQLKDPGIPPQHRVSSLRSLTIIGGQKFY